MELERYFVDKISRKIEQNECIYKASNDVVGIVFVLFSFCICLHITL